MSTTRVFRNGLLGAALVTMLGCGTTESTCALSVSAGIGGTAQVLSGGDDKKCGRVATVQASPQAGYAFQQWTRKGDLVSSSNPYSFAVASDVNLLATFVPVSYTVTASSNPAIGGSTAGGGSFLANSQATVTATAATGYLFVDWKENGSRVSLNASYTFAVTGNRLLVANFEPQCSLIVSAGVGGSATINSGGASGVCGRSVSVLATPAAGYTFVNWTDGTPVATTTNPWSFALQSNKSLTANFAAIPLNYTVATSSAPTSGGSTSGAGSYSANTQVSVTATPSGGWQFVSWTENGIVASTSATYTFAVSSNRSLVANFTQISYSIATSSNPSSGGTTGGSGVYAANSQATITSTPASGWRFVNWTENGSDVTANANFSFTVTGNRSFVANFARTDYVVVTSSTPSQGGATSGGGTFAANSQVTVTATPASAWRFVNWTENANVVSTSASYTFVLTTSRNLVANFTTIAYTISTLSSPANGGTTIGGGTFPVNSQATVIATPAAGFIFVNWTESGTVVSANPSYSFAVTGNRAIVGNFAPAPPTSITLSPRLLVLAAGGTSTLTASTTPTSVTARALGVASSNGLVVTGVAPGVTDVVALAGAASDSSRVAVTLSEGFALIATTSTNTAFPLTTAGSSITVSLWMLRPVGGSGDVGSIQGTLQWDPARATLQGEQGTAAGWTWIANSTNSASGTLGFAAFSATGAAQQVLELARLTFAVSGGAAGANITLTPTVTAAGSSAGGSIKAKVIAVLSAIKVN